MKLKEFVVVAIIVLVIIVVSGCVTEQESRIQRYEQPQDEQRFTVVDAKEHFLSAKEKVTVIHDNKENVTCWMFRGYGEEGVSISCIPDWQLTPPQNMSRNCNCT